jgi:hypothetical protein
MRLIYSLAISAVNYLEGEGEWSNHDVNISPEQPGSSDSLVSI